MISFFSLDAFGFILKARKVSEMSINLLRKGISLMEK